MYVYVVTETRFVKDSSNNYYSIDGTSTYAFWKKYLNIFEHVIVVARVCEETDCQYDRSLIVNGTDVSVFPITYYVGMKQFALKSLNVSRELTEVVKGEGALICRLPGILGSIACVKARKFGKKYAVELVGDILDVLESGTVFAFLRPLMKLLFPMQIKQCCRSAVAVSYVTKYTLQKRYSIANNIFTTNYSSIELHADCFRDYSYKQTEKKTSLKLLSIGSLEQLYKGPDVALKAVKSLNMSGVESYLTWLGDGKYIDSMRALAENLGITKYVKFVGRVSAGQAVRNYLEDADIFILPSRTEGLPRAMIEAMAMSLPCVGTSAGGIPELLDEIVVVPVDDISALVSKIKELWYDEEFFNQQAKRNRSEAEKYLNKVLQERRDQFFLYYKQLLEKSL